MPVCYWTLCHCPDAQPCGEHEGIECSMLGGRQITDESQVEDAVTRDSENAILALAGESRRLADVRARLEARKAELERDRDDFQRLIAAARNRAGRQAVIDRREELIRRYQDIDRELLDVVAELDAIAAGLPPPASSRVIIPYSSAVGYCACYDRKRDRLAVIAREIAAEQANLGALTAQYNALRSDVYGEISNLAGNVSRLRVTSTLTVTAAIFAYLLFGLTTALVYAAVLILLAVAIVVVVSVIQLAVVRSALLASRVRIARLFLAYYRVQQIPTCRMPPAEGDDPREREQSDEEWWERFFRLLEPEPQLPRVEEPAPEPVPARAPAE